MKKREIRLLINENLYKEYKTICVQLDLSVPKQTACIIEEFVKIQKENLKLINMLKV